MLMPLPLHERAAATLRCRFFAMLITLCLRQRHATAIAAVISLIITLLFDIAAAAIDTPMLPLLFHAAC